uniref:U32-Nephitoxin-Nsp1a_1 n=1 Tax=Nephila sp. SGP-2016 TaxID=1905176 RepID=A0A4Q8K1N4_9ARAC
MIYQVVLLLLIATATASAAGCNPDCTGIQCGWPRCPGGQNPVMDKCVSCCPFCPPKSAQG